MTRILYFDCFSGISGDMLLGALLDAGLPLDDLKRALGSLAVAGYEVTANRVLRAGVSATKFDVHETGAASHEQAHAHAHSHSHPHAAPSTLHDHAHGHSHSASGTEHAAASTQHVAPSTLHPAPGTLHDHAHLHHPHRSLPEIYGLIDGSALTPTGRDRAKALFQRLAEAEAAIHQMPVERVHLHEVGALDSIIDIVGAVYALDWFGADRIVSSPLNVGGGTVHSAHGVFPVPAPATLSLLGPAPIYSGAIQQELVTPTGALLVSGYASTFGPIPAMTVEKIGYGAGSRDFASTPNVLRVLVGRAADQPSVDRVTVLECEIDDMNPQIFGAVMDRLYAAGALEVFYVPVQMKKNRPGTLLTVIARPEHRAAMTEIVFSETTTIGLRHTDVERECLPREIVAVETPLGAVRFKVARRDGRVVNAAPEFEDCLKLATANHLSVKEVQALALKSYQR